MAQYSPDNRLKWGHFQAKGPGAPTLRSYITSCFGLRLLRVAAKNSPELHRCLQVHVRHRSKSDMAVEGPGQHVLGLLEFRV